MNILVTNFDNTGEDVMIFTSTFTPMEVAQRLTTKKKSFEECYQVPDGEVQYYIY